MHDSSLLDPALKMKITILGCGTSTGVPLIGCHCEVCSSADPRNKRTRSSALVSSGGKNILIDTSTDLRFQALSNNLEKIDAVLFTHPHADHIHGIDDLRSFNMAMDGAAIPCFGSKTTIERIRVMFDYIFKDNAGDGWKPNLETTAVDGPFDLFGNEIIPIEVSHGNSVIYGYRMGKLAYITDCSEIPEVSLEKLKGIELLVLGALRHKPHPTHFTVEQAIEASMRIKPEKTFLTHLGHNLDYARDNALLPSGIELAYDGLSIEA